MFEFIATKLTFLIMLSGAAFAMPAEAIAAIPVVADVAVEYMSEILLLGAAICFLIAVDTMSWPILTKKK